MRTRSTRARIVVDIHESYFRVEAPRRGVQKECVAVMMSVLHRAAGRDERNWPPAWNGISRDDVRARSWSRRLRAKSESWQQRGWARVEGAHRASRSVRNMRVRSRSDHVVALGALALLACLAVRPGPIRRGALIQSKLTRRLAVSDVRLAHPRPSPRSPRRVDRPPPRAATSAPPSPAPARTSPASR